jgi:hypothetical protein
MPCYLEILHPNIMKSFAYLYSSTKALAVAWLVALDMSTLLASIMVILSLVFIVLALVAVELALVFVVLAIVAVKLTLIISQYLAWD